MVKIFSVLMALFFCIPTLNAQSIETCMEMTHLHYIWLLQGRNKLAKKQLKIANKTCKSVSKTRAQKLQLSIAVEKNKELKADYKKLVELRLVNFKKLKFISRVLAKD